MFPFLVVKIFKLPIKIFLGIIRNTAEKREMMTKVYEGMLPQYPLLVYLGTLGKNNSIIWQIGLFNIISVMEKLRGGVGYLALIWLVTRSATVLVIVITTVPHRGSPRRT